MSLMSSWRWGCGDDFNAIANEVSLAPPKRLYPSSCSPTLSCGGRLRWLTRSSARQTGGQLHAHQGLLRRQGSK